MKLLETIKASFVYVTAMLMMIAIASPAVAQDNQNNQQNGFDSWDANGDASLDEDEFTTGLSDMGYYDEWDANGDGNLTEEEWNTGMDENFGDTDANYSDWDTDGDGTLTEDEFGTGVFDTVDENDDDSIGEDEFGGWFEDGLF